MCNMHKESWTKSFSDIDIIVFWRKVSRCSFQVEPIHNAAQLLAHIISRFQTSIIDEVIITPLKLITNKIDSISRFANTLKLRRFVDYILLNLALVTCGSSIFCLKAWYTFNSVKWSPSMWANRNFESSAAFRASFGRTKHCGTDNIAKGWRSMSMI